ncbi:hypothetical protein EIP91_001167 [Steccherinum ochraceum]|uniref:C2H2-type domain-containing protein n=1 Tax=Steccherinum ochraceum TaxID=92696 RepID=A0A4R0RXQ4_9APHY|nr:hypothetical protein EIP91_001167 [Steccherinum ochraceum]
MRVQFYILSFFLVFVLFTAMPPTPALHEDGYHRCVEGCGSQHESQKGLLIHQKTCKIANQSDSQLVDLQKRIQENRAQKKLKKRKRLENDVGPVAHPGGHDGNAAPVSLALDDFETDMQVDEPFISPEEPPPEPEPEQLGRGRRKKRGTWKVIQNLPQPTPPVSDEPVSIPTPSSPTPDPALQDDPEDSVVWKIFRSAANIFGIYREYHSPEMPTHHPDDHLTLHDLTLDPDPLITPPTSSPFALASLRDTDDAANSEDTSNATSHLASAHDDRGTSTSTVFESGAPTTTPMVSEPPPPSTPAPFANWSVYWLMKWMWSGSDKKSLAECNALVSEVIQKEGFDPSHFANFDAGRETAKLDAFLNTNAKDGWKTSDVTIEVPDGKRHQSPSDPPVPTFSVPGLHHRSIVEIIKTAWTDASADKFHFLPFKQYWRRSADKVERIHDEIYSSDAFIRAHEDLQHSKPEEGCTLERVVCALMFWSDSTHLASFGDASLWPLYMFFGNQSKYVRGRPNSGACHHVAYIPKLPDKIRDFFSALTGKSLSDDAQTLCRRDLMHSVWRLLLDADFRHAYVHGIIIKCTDGITRRVYPRLFTYSADYPEKVLLATIRSMGDCLCPRCKILKPLVPELGMIRDFKRRLTAARVDNNIFRSVVTTARNAIYKAGAAIKARVVGEILDPQSLIPVKNAFSEFAEAVSEGVAPHAWNFFTMFVPDLMHEFELGEFKRFFTYLIRLLEAIGAGAVQEMNRRYRLMPTFGRFTIRKKSVDTSALKKLAAHDYEDYVRTAMPVFEKLFPNPLHDKLVQDMLFTLADWHALAKLRMHTDSSLALLRATTASLGKQYRFFVKNVCGFYDTKELAREEAARNRRRAAAIKAGKPTPPATAGKLKKTLNVFTYKHHALGDYPDTIVMFGTTDSYSTQQGELEHRRVKRFYARTNKNNAVKQITNLHRREEAMRSRKERIYKTLKKKRQSAAAVLEMQSEPLSYTPPEYHHEISRSQNFPSTLPRWANLNRVDPAMKDFYRKLQDHLYSRLLNPGCADVEQTFTNAERQNFLLLGSRIYRHKVFRVNYTTYDVRRGQDSMNPSSHPDIMVPARDLDPDTGESPSGHPYAYARILGVFHAAVSHRVDGQLPTTRIVEFLLVRWFRLDTTWKGGFEARRLYRIEFLPESDPNAFGFLDPDDVIRGSHLIPAFAYGLQEDASLYYSDVYKYYYVNFFVDRDMYMRYRGLGVGHSFIRVPQDQSAVPPPCDDDDDDDIPDVVPDGADDDDDDEEEGGESGGDHERDEDEADPEVDPEDGEGDENAAASHGYAAH